MLLKIPRLYDSHTHWLATGEYAENLSLHSLKSPNEISELKIEQKHFRGEWLIGFGWDENKWIDESKKTQPHRKFLDKVFPNFPVLFQRADGHSSWCNTFALKKLNILDNPEFLNKFKDFLIKDENGELTGVLTEAAHIIALEKLPQIKDEQVKSSLLSASKIFNQAGFTHIRDMTSSKTQWQIASQLEDSKELTLCVESFFVIESKESLDSLISEVLYAKKNQKKYLRAKGIKIFFDGSLGSETALLSKAYADSGKQGVLCWSIEDVGEIIKATWQAGLEVAIHTIGDQAAHLVAEKARALSAQGFVGTLNLEHVQVLRPETIQMLKPLHVHCHMQPCHYLTDKVWLKDKLGELYKYAFPWKRISNAKIPLHFGSDSPIEPPSIQNNLLALELAAKSGIESLDYDAKYFSHPDTEFTNSYSIFENNKLVEVFFDGKKII